MTFIKTLPAAKPFLILTGSVFLVALVVGAFQAAAAGAGSPQAGSPQKAAATMSNTDGEKIGTIDLVETPNGVLLKGRLESVPEGVHAFHIHETGRCDPASGFKSAGGHLAGGHKHGFKDSAGPHPGDMANVYASEDEVVELEAVNARVDLGAGERANLLDRDGAALVLHAGADDYESQPSGAAGDRIACGVIEKK